MIAPTTGCLWWNLKQRRFVRFFPDQDIQLTTGRSRNLIGVGKVWLEGAQKGV